MAAPQQRGLRRRIADWFINNAGWIRFTIWLAFVFIAIGLDTYLYLHRIFITEPEIFTGVLIAVVTIAPFFYREFVAAPILMIEVPEENVVRKPEFITYSPPCLCPAQQPQQTQQQVPAQLIGYLRLRVRNTGLAAAEKCVFQVKITRWPSNCPINCHAPSDEYVDWQDVTWAGWEPHILIRPNDVRYANIAIMPLDANKQACLHAPWQCDNQVNPCGPLIAWIAKRETFMQGCRSQDGLVPGEYRIDAQVTCRNGQKTVRGLRLRVDQNWNATDITTA
jgi:hypothetical protein